MEIKFFGGNCIKITHKKASVIVDDISKLGNKSVVSDKDIQLVTDVRFAEKSQKAHFVIDGPGEYEVSEVSISGIPARSHIDEEGTSNSTIYKVTMDDTRFAVIGHIHPSLSEDQLEQLGTIDIMFVPVGGNGYTLDPIGAKKIIHKVEPKIVVPTHYSDKALTYEVPQVGLEDAIKEIGMEPAETTDAFKLKTAEFSDTTKLVVITKK